VYKVFSVKGLAGYFLSKVLKGKDLTPAYNALGDGDRVSEGIGLSIIFCYG
jgi:hypothetical protein